MLRALTEARASALLQEEEHSVVASTVVNAAVTAAACVVGGIARVLVAQITTRALLRRARIQEDGRTARIHALGERYLAGTG